MNEQDGAAPTKWQDQVFDLLRQGGVTQFAYVPDAGHIILIDRSLADPDVHSIALTTEKKAWRSSPAPTSGAAASCSCKAAVSAIASTCCR
jgi:hypothetical protein